MKKIILMTVFALGLFTISLNSHAQQKPKIFNHYSTETLDALNVTPEQRQGILEMGEKYRIKFKELKDQQSSLPKNEYDAQWKKLSADRGKEYMQFLTAEQKETLKELRKAHQEKNQ